MNLPTDQVKVDSHQHYWITARTDYGWLQPSSGILYADYLPKQLKPHLKKFSIDKTVIVQAAPTTDETDFMLSIADEEQTVAGVVGWLDLESDDFEQQWLRYREHPKFVGIRPMIQDLPSEWIVQQKVIKHLKLLAEAQFPIDLQANPRHLPFLIQLLEEIPELWAVIDHIAKPPIYNGGEMEPWATEMKQLAAYPNVMCKLSGVVPGSKTKGVWTNEMAIPFVKHVIESFGKKKVMFGSDWPVCLHSATYEQVVELFEACLDDSWTDEERADVYGNNAIRFYHLQV